MSGHVVRIPVARSIRVPRPEIGGGADGTYACVCGGEHPYGSKPHTTDEVRQILSQRGRSK